MEKNNIYYEEYGNKNGQPIIFINGWGTDHQGLEDNCLEYYEKIYRCIFVDAIGCGQSRNFTLEELKSKEYLCEITASEILKLINSLDLKNVIIYGNCVGGWIGTLMCLKDNSRIAKLIFIDGYLYFDKEYLPFVLPIIRLPFYKFFFQSKTGLSLTNFFVKFSQKISPVLIEEQKRINPKVAVDYIIDLYKMEKNGYRNQVQKIKTKSLFLAGEHTLPVIKRSMAFWKNNVENSECGYVAKSSHLTVSENPLDLNSKILDFIRN